MNSMKHTWTGIALLLPFAVILSLNAGHYLPFLSDDSLISLRYADRLLNGHGLTWTDGRPVEGYSNLLWILLIALLGLIHVDLIDAARILGIAGMAAIMFSIPHYYLRRNDIAATRLPIAISLLFLSLAAPIAVWAVGGLEQPLYGALIAVSIVQVNRVVDSRGANTRNIIYLSFVLGLLCITRPDGPVFVPAAALSVIYVGRHHGGNRLIKNLLPVVIVPLVFYAGQTLFRLYYYGELVPNTALVKITPSYHHLVGGLEYLIGGLTALFPFSLMAAVSLLAILTSPDTRARGVYYLGILAIWSAYIVFIGGDIFPAYRHFIPIIVVIAFLLVEGFHAIKDRWLKFLPAGHHYLYAALWLLLFIPYGYIQFTDTQNQRAIHERWEWTGRDLGLILKDAFSAQQPLVAVTAAGCIPYWSKLPALDMLGLNDYYLPRHRPKDIGNGLLGHELGDGNYVLSRRPDIIVFNVGSGPHFRTGRELQHMQAFHQLYKPILIKISGHQLARVYINRYSERIGIRQYRSEIIVPGYLFNGKNTFAYPGMTGRLLAQVRSGRPVSVTFKAKTPQNWGVAIQSTHPEKIHYRLSQDKGLLSITLSSDSPEPVDIDKVVLGKRSG